MSVRTRLLRFWRTGPVTMLMIGLAIALSLAETALVMSAGISPGEAKHRLGAVTPREFRDMPELHGPFGLWDGQWWRVPVSAFHHGGIAAEAPPVDVMRWAHLVLNCLALAFLGELLEPRLRRIPYVVFLAAAAIVSMLPELLVEHSAYGLSGVACAMFGALLVLRRHDTQVARLLSPGLVQLVLLWLLLCIPLTMLEILPVANLAHFAGLAYGWTAAYVGVGMTLVPKLRWPGLAAAHLVLLPALYVAVNPVWNGRYPGLFTLVSWLARCRSSWIVDGAVLWSARTGPLPRE